MEEKGRYSNRRNSGRRYTDNDFDDDFPDIDMGQVEEIERNGRRNLSSRRASLGSDAGRLASRESDNREYSQSRPRSTQNGRSQSRQPQRYESQSRQPQNRQPQSRRSQERPSENRRMQGQEAARRPRQDRRDSYDRQEEARRQAAARAQAERRQAKREAARRDAEAREAAYRRRQRYVDYDDYDDYDYYDDIDRDEVARMIDEDDRRVSRRVAKSAQAVASGRGGGGNNGRGGNNSGNGGKPRKKHRALKVILAIVIILAAMAVVGIIALKSWFNKGYTGEADVLTNDIDPNYDVWDNYINILVLGTDGTHDTDGQNGADVDILVSINKDTGGIRMMSFYRDLYLADETGYTDKLTNIFRHGDAVSSINALNLNYDLNINEYVVMGWDDVAEAIDLLGGVDVNVPLEMFADVNGYIENTAQALGKTPEFLTVDGEQTLTGMQAVAYCRIRYTNVTGYSMGDFGRSERQREVLSALFTKARSANIFSMMNLARTMWPRIQTSLSMNEVLALVPVLRIMSLENTAGFPRSDESVDNRRTASPFGASVVYSADTLGDISWIYEYLFDLSGYTPSAQAQEFASKVASECGG